MQYKGIIHKYISNRNNKLINMYIHESIIIVVAILSKFYKNISEHD